ncbi:MAG: UDP-N-acetylmuramoyl-L-alanine--D-glutamate ligase [Peptoniphilus harei]|uniref:UDP-N-acetylmuramoyl-L-alanine--D-glutamate ligase n=1 Tax=Peptoniphilus harei TaxID=54005 RepID=UPI00290C4FE8|nr:UDP-N-acetylmuramoyl-L-alanine--D-glutamate ligase [Peptoniphilus harei]MDU5470964.1 UDP-N-acetylmuramoyl-L-alanine--D-glutamate ligase [Peptoniphilus harei]MDU6098629.1 UDP-N-acetylmuramoyl-L-alanine--D-glutamate ligase [Peptoniphilus harei]
MIENKNILIMGFGVTGKTALRFLKEFPCKIYVYDSNQDLHKLNVEEDFIIFKEEDLDDIDLIVKSPGIYPFHELLEKAREKNIEIISDIELSYRNLKTENVIAVTGTNGKTTTTTILGDILKRVAKTYVVGNIGRGILEITKEASDNDYVVIEASSFQLEDTIDFKPHIGVLTYVTSDHLDWHKTRQNYVDAKFKIFKNQDENDFAILNYEDKDLAEEYKLKAEKYYFSMEKIGDKGAYVDNGKIYFNNGEKTEEVLDIKDIKIPGDHNVRNIMAAIIACKLLNIDLDLIKKSILSFTGVEHRIEFVREVDGVKYYNDSKGTNPDSTEVAVAAMDGDVVLIAGGYDKGADFDNLIEKSKDKIKTAILFGETAEKISNSCKKSGVEFYITEDLKKAVELARKLSSSGDDVLLSPACASWDMYKSYEIRGQHFKDLVKELM